MTRVILIISFCAIIFLGIFFSISAYIKKDYQTLTSSISLIISIISAWIAYEAFYTQSISKNPLLALKLDFDSRYDLIQLILKNHGERPAFNIKVDWDKPLKNHKGNIITFNKYNNETGIPILNPGEGTSVLIDVTSKFFEVNKPHNLNYSGDIRYSEAARNSKTIKQRFSFSFEQYGDSLSFNNELPKTLHELQKIPEKLDELKKALDRFSRDI